MDIIDIIIKKRNKHELTKEEIDFFIYSLCDKKIELYQASSLLMAILLNGMTDEETYYLTDAMLKSGDFINLDGINGIKVDKHSSGGVGDKTSLVLSPLLASFGIKVAKMSGRGLGHTGGTLDKLESIPGFNVNLAEDLFIKQVNEVGCAIIGQQKNLVPADKVLYALRDVTGTVESIPLIASSIMSKKLSANTDIISLDVKVGSGAFMKTLDSARELARLMIKIGRFYDKKVTATITNMDSPLGAAVGNSLEVCEAIKTLNGNGPKDFTDLCVTLCAEILVSANVYKNHADAEAASRINLTNGKAFNIFKEMVKSQGGDISYIDDMDKFPKALNVIEVKSKSKGYINVDALAIGNLSMKSGAGRLTLEDSIDYSAGVYLNKKTGDYVNIGDVILTIYTNKSNTFELINYASESYTISDEKVEDKLILDIIQ